MAILRVADTLKCVLRLSCVVHGPIYGPFMGFYVNGFPYTLNLYWAVKSYQVQLSKDKALIKKVSKFKTLYVQEIRFQRTKQCCECLLFVP